MADSSSRVGDSASYQERRPTPTRFAPIALAICLVTAPAVAEITTGGERPRVASQGQSPTVVGAELAGDVRARCWQEGREILAEADFQRGAIPPGLREQAIQLEGRGQRVVLLPFGETFCLLTVRP
jgi:hypothetical protein